MAQKCVHKACGKVFSDPEEECVYHPGPPVFHEGQKGWNCCKPRVLTFDEFLAIPPCTTGKHSVVDDSPTPPPKPVVEEPPAPTPARTAIASEPEQTAQAAPSSTPAAPPEPESEDDDTSLPIPANKACRRRGCGATSSESTGKSREGEKCVFHPGQPVFHEGQKGWTCCKRRVLEFDEFMRIEGCSEKDKHMFVGSGQKDKGGPTGEKLLETVRTDFYQTGSTVHASLYLKKIRKDDARIEFSSNTTIDLDLPTADKTRYKTTLPLFGSIDTEKSKFKILGTKLDLELVKTDGRGWPVLRADDARTGEIIQTGQAGRA